MFQTYTLTIKSAAGVTGALKRSSTYTGHFIRVSTGINVIFENIIMDGNKDAISVSVSGSLLYNIGNVTFNNVIVQKASRSGNSVIHIRDGAKLTMNDSKITNNEGTVVNVYVSGTFIMNSGEISNNISSGGDVAGVRNNGTFIMNGGKITGNSGTEGQGNSRAGVETSTGFFAMYGGEISGNKSNEETSGVYISGSIGFDEFIVGGTAKITGNTRLDGTPTSNFWLGFNRFITLAEGENAPKNGMEIGVTKRSLPNGTMYDEGVFVQNGATENHTQYFFADNPALMVVHDDGQLKLVDNNCENHEPPAGFAAPLCHESAKNYNCKNCGAIQTVQPSAHDFGRWVERLPATDLYPAVEELMCNNTACDESSGIFKGRGGDGYDHNSDDVVDWLDVLELMENFTPLGW